MADSKAEIERKLKALIDAQARRTGAQKETPQVSQTGGSEAAV